MQVSLQRREFNNRAQHWKDEQSAALQQWERQRENDREAWALTHDLEREKQLLPERLRVYGDFITALDDALVAGIAAAEQARAPGQERPPSLAHLSELLDQLGAPDVPVRQTALDVGWAGARSAADHAGARAVLVTANDSHRTKMQGALFTLWQVDPIVDPYSFMHDEGTVGAGDAARELRDARNEVERAALHELGFGSHSTTHG